MAARPETCVRTVAPPLRLLVMQPTPFCNINCSYCYLAERTSKARMSLPTLRLACHRVLESPYVGRQLTVAWHSGEPLVVPISWYVEALDLMAQQFGPAGIELTHSFQTNGILLTDAWASFFARTGAGVGLSIDGPADLHDANRRTRQGHGTHAAVMKAARTLQKHGVPFHVITVLTEGSLDRAEELFDFYVRHGLRNVGFNIEEIEGSHRASSLRGNGIETRFRRFIARFFELVRDAPGLLTVREFESALEHLLAREGVSDEQNTAFAILSVSWNGIVSTFSPELLSAQHPRFGRFGFGQLATHSLSDIEHTTSFKSIAAEIHRGVEACRRTCRYFRWCGGGVPANKLFETGRFDATETMHCRLSRQAVIDGVIAGLEAHPGRVATASRQRASQNSAHSGGIQ